MLTNVGLDEQLGRQIRYTGRMGPDVGALLADTTLATTTKAVLAGVGFENGGPVSIGAGKRGRVWSNLRLRVNQFAAWCKSIGSKIDDPNIDPEQVLRGTLIPRLVESRPAVVPVGVDWPVELLDHVESATTISFETTINQQLTNVSIELRDYSDSVRISAIVDAHFRLIVDGKTVLPWAAPGRRAGTGLTVVESSTISLKRPAVVPVSGMVFVPT
jgi:hypothetical protein